MPAQSAAEEKILPIEEAVDCSQQNEGIKEVTFAKDVQDTDVEGSYVMCDIGGEKQPASIKAPPQKRRAVSGNAGPRIGAARGPRWLREDSKHKRTSWGQKGTREYGEKGGLKWRKCSGFARQRLGPKLMNQCKQDELDTEEHGNMFKTNLQL